MSKAISFKEYHLYQILSAFESLDYPLDLFLRNYFRTHKALGSKDRRFIAETVYGLTRWRGLIDHLVSKPVTWEKRVHFYLQNAPINYLSHPDVPPHIRVSFPKLLFQLLEETYGQDALLLCADCNFPAPTTVRANLLKTTQNELLNRFKDRYEVSPTPLSPWGLTFKERINFSALDEFKAGLFEVQDEASQLVAQLVRAQPKEKVLDFCAGGGGKALAIAPQMQGKGQLFIHDIRPQALKEAKKRLCRAGIYNALPLVKGTHLKKMDWVLVDVPCSGTGTLRRNPDLKWKFSPSGLEKLIQEQRAIFAEALQYLHPNGSIIYATCSLLSAENEQQISLFEEKFSLQLAAPPFRSLPSKGGMDGFFAAVLKLKRSYTKLQVISDIWY